MPVASTLSCRLDGRGDSPREVCVIGDQDRLGVRIVLGLGQQIGGDPVWIIGGVGHDDDLGRAGQRIYADHAVDAALGRGDIGVSGPDDLVDAADRPCAIGERGDGLSAADAPGFPKLRPPARPSNTAGWSLPGGVTMAMRSTPATLAGITFISTVDG